MGQISKFFLWKEYFAPELDASGHESFFPEFFNHFARPTGKNLDSVFLTGVRLEPGNVILRCDQMGQIFKFLPWREYFAPELDASSPQSFSPEFFNHFGHPRPKILIWSF